MTPAAGEPAGPTLPAVDPAALYAVNRAAMRYWHRQFLASPIAQAYFASRRWPDPLAVARRYQVGFAPGPGDRTQSLVATLRREGVPGVARSTLDVAMQHAGVARLVERTGDLRDFFVARLIFPIPAEGPLEALAADTTRIAGFGGRFLAAAWPTRPVTAPEPPKYLNTPETPIFAKRAVLYGWPWAEAAVRKRRMLLVTEGYLDCLRVREAVDAGYAVACCGTALTADHLRTVRRSAGRRRAPLTVYLMTDSDAAGRRAAERGARLALQVGFQARIVQFEGGKDPDELLRDGTAASRAQFAEAVARAETPVMNYVEVVRARAAGSPAWPHALAPFVALLRGIQHRSAAQRPEPPGAPPAPSRRSAAAVMGEAQARQDLIRQDAERLVDRLHRDANLTLSLAQALDLLGSPVRHEVAALGADAGDA